MCIHGFQWHYEEWLSRTLQRSKKIREGVASLATPMPMEFDSLNGLFHDNVIAQPINALLFLFFDKYDRNK